jgi:histidinol phosphatase-like PHP family hydrolase
MALEVATGFTGSLGGALGSIAYIVARDVYHSVVQEMKKQPLVEPEYLQLSGNFEQDVVRHAGIVNQLRKQIADNVQEEMEKARAKAKSVEAQSKIDRNLAPATYDSGPLAGWSHPQTVKAFNQRSKTGREYK